MKAAWPKISKVENHGLTRYLVDARIGGKGPRQYFATRAQAEGWAQTQKVRRQNEGGAVFHDQELRNFGWTVQDAIKFALEHLRRQKGSVPLPEAVAALIASKRASGRSERYCHDLGLRLNRFSTVFDGKTMAQVSTPNIETFLEDLGVSAQTRNTFRRDIRTLWSFAERRGWAIAATAKNTEVAKVIDHPPGILSVKQASCLLSSSRASELIAYHSIGLFAGLRVAEMMQLDWKAIDFQGGFIHVAAAVSKTRSRRLVPILDNLRSWLTPLARKSGPIISSNLRIQHEAARRAAGFGRPGTETEKEKAAGLKLQPWPENGMRHSFVSYRLAATQNAPQTALESGHDQAVLFRHYRELVRPVEADQYFSIGLAS